MFDVPWILPTEDIIQMSKDQRFMMIWTRNDSMWSFSKQLLRSDINQSRKEVFVKLNGQLNL